MTRPSCNDREPQLEALLFGEIDGAERLALEEHLTQCPGCSEALEEARTAMNALALVSDPPLPYEEADRTPRAWNHFLKRLPVQAPTARLPRAYQFLALAAMLVLGIGLGRWAAPTAVIESSEAELDAAAVPAAAPAQIDALERAELLADAGMSYVEGLQELLVDVMRLSVDAASTEDLLRTRERASELLRDGQLLELALDRDEDRDFLRAIRRAELFLEELAAVEGSGSSTSVAVFQASLRDSHLGRDLAALNLERDVSLAIEAAGWIALDEASRKDF